MVAAAAGQWRALWQAKTSPHDTPHDNRTKVAIGRLAVDTVSGGAIKDGKDGYDGELTDLARSQQLAALSPQLEWFGGLSFDTADRDPTLWGDLADGGFFTPRWLVNLSAQGATLTVYMQGESVSPAARRHEMDRLHSYLKGLFVPSASPAPLAAIAEEETPDFASWQQLMADAISRSAAGKVVLARKKTFRFAKPPSEAALIRHVASLNPHSFVFAVCAPDGRSFMGCSPERLARWQDGRVEIDAMAGTRPRAASASAQAESQVELQGNPKDQHEHRFVTDFIEATLREYCTDYEQATKESVVTLRHVQHLVSRFEGQLSRDHHPLQLVESLHPTPAVGGTPRQVALEFLRSHEPFSRGRFAAPVGCFSGAEGDFAIGIRSALIDGEALHVFAGAGIVEGSDPQLEWQETSVKMKNFTDFIAADSTAAQPLRHEDPQ